MTTKDLYEQDYPAWLEETAKQLRQRQTDVLDWEHLGEEIEALGNEQRHKVDSYLLKLLIHLLLYQYWPEERERCARGWQDEIGNFRVELELLLESKTLYNHFLTRIAVIYPKAVKRVRQKSQLPAAIFAESCPYSPEQILDSDFLP
ncbi:DUF29 domain-containing protein [Microcystis sp. LEGE 00066]|uniref:Genome sequencing data, contig C301 n=2 Tax=Microcystis aeruginosa (strain PCC 7806) TaxID=267872 RepID=A8YEV1_MICA7|nr:MULTISPECIES: DUF29 domain-containing protein [Microcystis]TRU05539.1 MAG: DUF29 domain-containing protein [Microcystis aeruginosa Ma_AC_P_19900807_S300]ARI81735.1 hypothetical protein BH695_2455 [Microcystis aeruginosa PCC 7806SL]ELS47410.1 hypothetical protein C789_2813 [Microcystis aeruginosa FACHB-905 = DIANCHI905]MBE9261102.1 DUF29 domain-containing protein [Microcystis sp. LEGE 00066]UGS11237.1 DUF29 domain-containing protein [Microcystis aeruginosa FACHB-905 = DIANCHI905]